MLLLVNQKWVKLLRTHYHASNRTISATQLAKTVGYGGYQGVNLQYGKLGYEIEQLLHYTPSETYKDCTPIWTWVLAKGHPLYSG